MARKRDPNRDKALEIFIEHNGEVANRKVASLLSVPEKTISAWKSRDKWNEVLQKNNCSTTEEKCSTTNKGGAPPRNQNAKGNKGNKHAAPPSGNKNAVKTGEFETIFVDTLTEEERDIYSNLSEDPSFILLEEIRLLKIRQHRMMKRIKEAEEGLNQKEIAELYELRGRKQFVDSEKNGKKIAVEVPVITMTEKKEKTFRKIEDILSIEDALTRVSNQLARAVKQFGELELNKKRKKLIEAQAKIASLKAEELELEIVPPSNPNNDNDEVPDDIDSEIIKLEQELGIDRNG
ncbi:phage terminase small subunit [Enterococcus sp. UD-01]|jgi:phage terminase small subunit|uniref:phage terminase small subunit n=1 Tax=Enterococcus sp. UD-01 TaxID=3373911 RepID=UPI003833136E